MSPGPDLDADVWDAIEAAGDSIKALLGPGADGHIHDLRPVCMHPGCELTDQVAAPEGLSLDVVREALVTDEVLSSNFLVRDRILDVLARLSPSSGESGSPTPPETSLQRGQRLIEDVREDRIHDPAPPERNAHE